MNPSTPRPPRGARARFLALVAAVFDRLHALACRVVYGDSLVLLRLEGAAAGPADAEDMVGRTARFLTASEVADFAARGDSDLHLPYVRDALDRGDRCFAILEGDRLASYSWYAEGATGVTRELALHFPAPYRYMHHSFTVAAFRGRRLHTAGILLALPVLDGGRPVDLLAIVSRDNPASLKSCQRAGYRPAGHFWLLGAANRLALVTSRAARALGCALFPRNRSFAFISLASPEA